MFVCMYICLNVCMYACMYVYMYACTPGVFCSALRFTASAACFRRESVWSVLTGRGQETPLPSILLHDVREIETWILRLLSAPVPVPGKTRVEVSPRLAWR